MGTGRRSYTGPVPRIWVKKARKQNWWNPARWEVTKTYTVILNDETVLEIHVGFEFETSIPRIFWPLLSPTGTLFEAGGVHDFGYVYDPGGRGKDYWDLVFFQIAEREKHRKIAHPVAHKMVSLLGQRAWDGHRERNLQIPDMNQMPHEPCLGCGRWFPWGENK